MRSAVTTVEREAHLAAAAYLMQRGGRSALVVVTPGDRPRPLSVITHTDIARAVAGGMDVNAIRISEVVDRPVVLAHPDLAVAEAARIMLDADVRQLPVARDGTLVGVLEMADACRALLDPRPNQPTAVLAQPPVTPAAHT
jgi:CBS domain-containing protein